VNWIGIAVSLAVLAAVCAVLIRAMRKTRHNESWGDGALSRLYAAPLDPGQPPIEVVSEPEGDGSAERRDRAKSE